MTEFIQAEERWSGLWVPAAPVDEPAPTQWADPVPFEADVGALGEREVLDTLDAARQIRARADAVEARALARFHEIRGGSRYVADEVSLEMRVSRYTAQNRVNRALALTDRMPRLLGLMEAGEVDGIPAGRVCDVVAVLEDERARDVDKRLADKLASGRVGIADPTGMVRASRRLVEKIDPTG